MALEIEGKFVQAFELRSGTSANGNNWSSQDFLLEIPGQYVTNAVFNVFNNRVPLDQFHNGDAIKVSFDIRGREYQGRWYNTLNAWKVDRIGASAPNVAAAPTSAPSQPAGPVETPQAGGDDLPF
ncbi:MAG: DUF3127 domain-containing protein [Bacteroidales bacterium]|nr:DUF3127 domain-containing protein [Bacteroidales bacterium]